MSENISILVNHRFPGEDAVQYRTRRRAAHGLLKQYLRRCAPATPQDARNPVTGAAMPQRYVPGPHPSHKPRYVVTNVNVVPWTDAYGVVHDTREFKVLHPGTLVKIRVLK